MDCESLDSSIIPNQNFIESHKKLNHKFINSGFIVFTLLLMGFSGFFAYISKPDFLPHISNSNFEKQNDKVNIMLFGDSLIEISDSVYSLGKGIEESIESARHCKDTSIEVEAHGGFRVIDLLHEVDNKVLNRANNQPPPDAIIVLFDSDAVEVDEGDRKVEFRTKYKKNLSLLLEKLRSKIGKLKYI